MADTENQFAQSRNSSVTGPIHPVQSNVNSPSNAARRGQVALQHAI